MNAFNDYDVKYPDLIIDLMNYFSSENDINERSVIKFCSKYIDPSRKENVPEILVSPQIVNKICDILCNNNHLNLIKKAGAMGMDSNYLARFKDKEAWESNKNKYRNHLNSKVYGKEYIYNYYRCRVLPLVIETPEGDESIGTCFKLFSGIVTAKHCLLDAKTISIKGYSPERLKESKILIGTNDNLDLAYIELNEIEDTYSDAPNVLDDVLVMGYPRVPGFVEFLTVENATISSISEKVLSQTQGSIAAIEESILFKTKLMLIMARIRGGNSGGPIINSKGSVVGVACQSPAFEDDYDNLGYGVGFPIEYIDLIRTEKYELKNVNFIDFKY